MTNQTSKVQINYKLDDGTLINVYAENGPELNNLLEGLKEAAPLIRETRGVVAFGGIAQVASTEAATNTGPPPQANEGWQNQGPPPGWVPNQGQQQPTQQPQYSQPQHEGGSCVHGPKKWVPGGVSKKTGNSYNGFWACAAPQGQQCQR